MALARELKWNTVSLGSYLFAKGRRDRKQRTRRLEYHSMLRKNPAKSNGEQLCDILKALKLGVKTEMVEQVTVDADAFKDI
jgi:hypothetical protein